MFLSIVIAIYNEEENVRELTQRLYTSMNSLKIPFELIYVIDGTDRSFGILSEISKSKNNLILDHSPKLRGFKKAFIKGFSLASKKATHILTMDGDLNHQPEEIKNLIHAINNSESDIIIGSRYIEKGKIEKLALWKRAISLFANFVIKHFLNLNIRDKTSGFRLYKRDVMDKIAPLCKSNNFEFLLEILILANMLKYSITEEPIIFKAREKGKSKFNLWKTIKGYLNLVSRYSLKRRFQKPPITRYVANKRASLILNDLKKLDKNKVKILDVGCGDQYVLGIIRDNGYNIIGIDNHSSKNGKWIVKDPDYIMDAKHMSFEENSFDVVIALEVIEHCDCVSEIKRVLKPDGIFFCSTPAPSTDWARKILVSIRLLENQDFEGHDNIINLKQLPMKLLVYKKMFLGTSQFGVFRNKDK